MKRKCFGHCLWIKQYALIWFVEGRNDKYHFSLRKSSSAWDEQPELQDSDFVGKCTLYIDCHTWNYGRTWNILVTSIIFCFCYTNFALYHVSVLQSLQFFVKLSASLTRYFCFDLGGMSPCLTFSAAIILSVEWNPCSTFPFFGGNNFAILFYLCYICCPCNHC